MIKKIQNFIHKSLKANELLLQLISSESEVTIDALNMIVNQQPDMESWKLSVSQMESIMLLDPEAIKLETTFKIERVKSKLDLEEKQNQKETEGKQPWKTATSFRKRCWRLEKLCPLVGHTPAFHNDILWRFLRLHTSSA
ncbi:hypothetical protein evm_014967 [Chilo suppressalis]|nr:hypothetical protein evm_014967 [Chilo suppressalis]